MIRWAILIAWPLLAISFLRESFETMRSAALAFFAVVFLLAVFDLSFQWEVCEQACHSIKHSHYFEVDEFMQLKKILRALRWEHLAMLFEIPIFNSWKLKQGF